MNKVTRLIVINTFVFLSLLSFTATADEESKPFAEKRIVLQISDNNPFKQTLVLNVANNLVKHYGADKVDIEIVAFGPGLRLLFKDNSNAGRIQSLADNSGVTFSACSNTINNMAKKIGHPPVLNSNAVKVSAGVVQILDLVAKDYVLIKP
jgi:intracellular sulfur oxidation DsrE/DsrF family protein